MYDGKTISWKDPVPAERWTDVLTATTESSACQRDIFMQRFCGAEDCLHLNVYTKQLTQSTRTAQNANDPSHKAAEKCPVMVFMHGGAFMYGSNTKDLYSPEYLLRKDVVLLVVNYRLGAFGFLSVEDESASVPGNAGLKDQVAALRWVRDNIAGFGGDPNNVTIFGESAGGCSVHYHLVSEMSRGLFHKAIVMSGSVLAPWAICPLKNLPERLAMGVGWTGEGGTVEMMNVLRTARPESLLKAQEALITKEEGRQYMFFPFGPFVEPYKSSQTFIPDDPAIMGQTAWSDQLPVIFSACSSEGLLLHKAIKKKPVMITNLVDRFHDMVPLELGGNDRESRASKRVGAAFKNFYFGSTEPEMANIATFENMMADKLFLHGIHRSIQMRLSQPNAGDTYMLRFDFDSDEMSFMRVMFAGRKVRGTCHADDCNYLFKHCIAPRLAQSSPEFLTMDRFVEFWTQFARTGNPNSPKTRELVQWDPVSSDKDRIHVKCLNLSNELTFIELPESNRMRFWDQMYEQHNTELSKL